ncbi:MAG: DUF3080 family protein [Pseudomonadota bacterium]
MRAHHVKLRATRTLIVCASLMWLAGCFGDPSLKRFENYHERLARSLKQSAHEAAPVAPPLRPARRELTVAPSDQRIGLIAFLKLYDCSLWQVIGERNSALGKVASASQQLFMELDFLRLAPECVATLQARGEDALARSLADAHALKLDELPIRIWQATLASEEFESLWYVPIALGDYEPSADLPLEDALNTVAHWSALWLDGDYRYDATAFEVALGRIRHGNAGFWLRAAALTESQLSAASQTAHDRVARRPLCFNGMTNQQGNILLNVVQKFFVSDVQVWAAEYNRVLYRVLQPHAKLEILLRAVWPAAYRDWVADRDTQLDAINRTARAHVAAVEPLLRSCSLLPK